MARARNIKPGFFRNEILAELEPLTRILFAGLWTIADRAGRLEDRPKRIKADVLPYDECDIDAMLDALGESGFIARYKHGAARYIQIVHFTDHQNPHKNEAESAIPPMPADGDTPPGAKLRTGENEPKNPATSRVHEKSGASTVQSPKQHSTNRADSLNTDSLSPEGINPHTPKRKRKGKQTLTPEQLARFERWYSEYPRKVNRAAAEKAWAEIDPDDELTDRMVSKTREWATSPEWTKDGGQYVPYPASWLNGSRWTDGSPSKHQPGALTVHSGGKPNPNKRGGYTAGELMQLAEEERRRETA